MSMWFIGFAIGLLICYVILILVYTVGWLLIPDFNDEKAPMLPLRFTILIPARNEEHLIIHCLEDIAKQTYSLKNFEVIVLDDHSTDATASLVNTFCQSSQMDVKLIRLQELKNIGQNKKSAITYGVSQAKGDYIILTDADCTRGDDWLSTITKFLSQHQVKMVYAPVAFKARTWFEEIQALEFAGLMGIGASAIRLKNPNMCSAANLIFKKDVFIEVEGYKGNEGLASGDDEFLLHKFFVRYPNQVHFLKNWKALVETSANVSLEQLTDQRRRWVSKSTKYENRYITLILVMAYLFNLLLLVVLFIQPLLGLLLMGIKMVTEGIFLYLVLSFLHRTKHLRLLPSAELFHILYVVIIGVWANLGKYEWKGRELK